MKHLTFIVACSLILGGCSRPGSGLPAESGLPEGLRWLHTDVSKWPATATLAAHADARTIYMVYDKAKVWPGRNTGSGANLNANPWVIVKYEGKWYAATFEWLRFGQTSKPRGVLDGSKGDHIKVSPLNKWRLRSGEKIGIMVSGLARGPERNVQERSNVVWFEVP